MTVQAKTAQAKIAVLGVGVMGAPMARNLLRAGFDVHVWNRTGERAEALVAQGARVASSPAEGQMRADGTGMTYRTASSA